MVNGSISPEERLKSAASTEAADVINQYDSRLDGHYNEELTTSRIKYGKNEVTNHNKHATLKRFCHAFGNYFILVLAAIDIIWPLTAIADAWGDIMVDGHVVTSALIECIDWKYLFILTTLILVSGITTFIQETRSSKAAAKLVSMVTTIITVRREGVETEIDSKELVVGDIIILDTGDMIPADVRIISSNHLKVDQSSLTGENGGVTKYADKIDIEGNILGANNIAFMGTSVVGGSAEAIVIAVGDDTVFGSMAEKLSTGKVNTTYDKGSKEITKVLIRLMLFMIPPVFFIMCFKYGYIDGYPMFGSDGYLLKATTFSMTLAIGLMPEMFATMVSTNLAKGAIEMSKNKVIVKDVNAIQNFGAMDVLCSDKTGTLTQNRISVKECCDIYGNHSHSVELFSMINSYNLNSATNQIDWALDEYCEEREMIEERDAYEPIGDVPFDFIRRRSTVIVKKNDDVQLMITKGAIPELLSVSVGYLDENREIRKLDEEIRNKILGLVEWYSIKGMRVLGVTHKYFHTEQTEFTEKDENEMIFAGFVVFTDPVKPSVKKAIKDMNEYGISVKVLTGDNEYVSRHICDEIDLETKNVLVGDEIDAMSDEELQIAVEENNVFARLTPDNKSRIVLALRANGHTVGLMGDGINDVIAMKNADVSISVDTGTDIAKETASMILLEKDLGILKDGAIQGRKVYVNSIKYVKMIGSINFGYMFSLIMATIFFNFAAMGEMMILIFNLINDFACLVTPWDTVDDEFVRKPRKWDSKNLQNVMYRYGPMCCVTDVMTWLFFMGIIANHMTVDVGEFAGSNALSCMLGYKDLTGTNLELTFASFWCIEQYWMQVWSIHIVRTNKLPFVQAKPIKMLTITTIIALTVGTLLPFTGKLWQSISGFDYNPYFTEHMDLVAISMVFMVFIALVYFFGSHLVKKRMLKTHGYFAC